MVSRDRVIAIVRYYLALFVLVIGSIQLIEAVYRDLMFWESVVVIVVLVVIFGQVLRQVGWDPFKKTFED